MSGFNDFITAIENENSSETPALGGANRSVYGTTGKDENSKIRVKYFVANIQDEGDRLVLEEIMTRALDSGQELHKVGQIAIFNEQSSLTKEGDALVMVKYAEVVRRDG
jgi:hypothetical protein